MNKEAVLKTRNKVKINKLINFDAQPANKVKVSIVVPVCNVETYLRECLDSIVNQTLREIEIICVNDGSKDGSEAILEEYAARDKRVKVIDKENAGYGHAMNIGMDMVQGEYIGIVESDDLVELNMYEDLYKIAQENDLDFIKANFNRFLDENGERKLFFNRIVSPDCYNRVLVPREAKIVFRGVMNTWSGIYKASFIKKFNIRHNETPGASYQDNGFYFQTFMFANRAYFCDKSYYLNRRDNPNSSVYSNSKIFCMRDEYEYIKRIMDKNQFYSRGLVGYYWLRKFSNYIFTCDRLDNDNLRIFLETFYSEFKNAKEKKLLDLSIFNNDELEKLLFLLENKEGYYEAVKRGELRISIIIPVYNEEKCIRKCLDSIFNQTLKDVEIICIDDGSTDNTLSILSEYKYKHENFKIIQQKNSGAGEARNKGLKAAEGEFIAFMDADDWYPSTTILKNLYIAAKRNNVKICGGSFSSFIKGKVVTEYDDKFSGYTFKENKLNYFSEYQFDYGYHRFIYQNKMLKENNIVFPLYRRFQDPPFFVRAMIKAKCFYSISQIVYCYRKDDTKLVWTREKVLDLLKGLYDNISMAKENNLEQLYYLNINRLNKDFVGIITSFILPENKDICIELFKLQNLVDEELISKALKSTVSQYIIKPLYRALFNGSAIHSNPKNNSIISDDKTYDAVIELKKYIQSYGEVIAIKSSVSYRIGRVITFLPRKIRDIFKKRG